jgi:undecaprenyl-diphosphatase
MQLGTLVGPAAVAIAAVWLGRDRLLAVASIIAGLVAWFGAKAVKQMIERSRPVEYLPDVDVREGSGEGLGYISGHSAVATTAAVMAMAMLPRQWRPVAAAVAALVGIARIIYGVHLPADVVGGWSFGTLIGLGSLAAVDAVEKRQRAKS